MICQFYLVILICLDTSGHFDDLIIFWGYKIVHLCQMYDSAKGSCGFGDVSRIAFTMSGTVDGRTERFEKPWFITFVMCPGSTKKQASLNRLLD